MEPLTTVVAIAQLIHVSMKISKEVLERVDERAAATGQTREEVFREVATAAQDHGQDAAASLARQAATINARNWAAYDALSPTNKALVNSLVPGAPLVVGLREMRRWWDRRRGD